MTLRVVTSARWLAEDLGGTHDMGLDLRGTAQDTWWCATRFAARLLASGVDPLFQACDAGWVARLPYPFRSRVVSTLSLGALHNSRHPMGLIHLKLADVKSERVPAMTTNDQHEFSARALAAGYPRETTVQWSRQVRFTREFRTHVVDATPTTCAFYTDVDGHDWRYTDAPGRASALAFAREVAADQRATAPVSYVLDVGCLPDGKWAVIEANAAWSSHPYSADPAAVAPAIAASQHNATVDPRWRWAPTVHERTYARPLDTTERLP